MDAKIVVLRAKIVTETEAADAQNIPRPLPGKKLRTPEWLELQITSLMKELARQEKK